MSDNYKTWSKPSLIHEYNVLNKKAEALEPIDGGFATTVRKQMQEIYFVLRERAIAEIADAKVDEWLKCENKTNSGNEIK